MTVIVSMSSERDVNTNLLLTGSQQSGDAGNDLRFHNRGCCSEYPQGGRLCGLVKRAVLTYS
jgi:hypothetical protein